MSDFIIISGDKAVFDPNFGPAMVTVRPGFVRGSGISTISSKSMCRLGDESSVVVPGCMYTAGPFSIPGIGTLKIHALNPQQIAKKKTSGNKPAILKGTKFIARFEVTLPAKQPPPGPGSPIPDSLAIYMGTGHFINTNVKHKGA